MSPGSSSASTPLTPASACTSVAATICWFMKYLPAFAANENPLGQSSCKPDFNLHLSLCLPLSLSLSLSSQGGVAHNLLWSVSHLESCQPGNNERSQARQTKPTRVRGMAWGRGGNVMACCLHATACCMLFWRRFLMPIGQFFAINLAVKINLL